MQTFLPYKSFKKSAECLDRRRLGKQRIEARQILEACFDETHGYRHHTAVQMWIGHEGVLLSYIFVVCETWKLRGLKNRGELYVDNQEQDVSEIWDYYVLGEGKEYGKETPRWLGHDAFHESHRSNLLKKDPEHYSQFDWEVGNDLEYHWPSRGRASSSTGRATDS